MPEVEQDGVCIYYEVSGIREAEVVMLGNSLGSNLHMWDKVVPWLESRYRVVRFNTRGHGKSSAPHGPYSIEDLGRDVLIVLDSLGVQRVNFCGLSLGGLVAMWLGIHAPDRVIRLVMANTGARIGTPQIWDQRIALVEGGGMAEVAEMTPARWFTPGYRDTHEEEMATIRQMVSATNPLGYAGCCGVLRDTDLRREIGGIAIPSLVVAGKHDPATPPSDGQAIHRELRNSRFVELDASHLSAWERAEEFAAEVVSFLEAGNG